MNKVTIVIPVYADWPSLADCIDSLIEFANPRLHQILIVNDCGPEADQIEKNISQKIADHSNFKYFRNPRNLGFVKTCNRAVLELDKTSNDIVLLNSDTKVTPGWLEEMVSVMYSSPKIAVVSPRSNNANNCTLPLAAFISGEPLKPEKSHALFMKYKDKLPRYREVPTGHGFCALIRRAVIKRYGFFDEAFSPGYGEEVDFCQRVIQHGQLCVLANRAFVYHLEARSFSTARKEQLLATRREMIYKRYPNFKPSLTKNIEDSLLEERRIMGRDAGDKTPYNLNNRTVAIKRLVRKYPLVHKAARVAKAQSKRLKNNLKSISVR